MIKASLFFRLPSSMGVLELSSEVLAHFEANKQRRCFSREAGGQLFATFNQPSAIKIVKATGPRATDQRSVFGYEPDRAAEKIEIWENYAQGFHFIGDWHTHRQKIPKPSSTDDNSMRDMVQQSSHDLDGFIMIIVGQSGFPEGIYVSFHSRKSSVQLRSLGYNL